MDKEMEKRIVGCLLFAVFILLGDVSADTGNISSDAVIMSFNVSESDTISENDTDWYMVNLTVISDLIVNFTAPSDIAYNEVTIYGPDNSSKYQKTVYADNGETSSETLNAVASGVYYLKVFNSQGYFSAELYTLIVTKMEAESNDKIGDTPSEASSSLVMGQISDSDTIAPSYNTSGEYDVDWFVHNFSDGGVDGLGTTLEFIAPSDISCDIDVYGPDDPTNYMKTIHVNARESVSEPVMGFTHGAMYFKVYNSEGQSSINTYSIGLGMYYGLVFQVSTPSAMIADNQSSTEISLITYDTSMGMPLENELVMFVSYDYVDCNSDGIPDNEEDYLGMDCISLPSGRFKEGNLTNTTTGIEGDATTLFYAPQWRDYMETHPQRVCLWFNSIREGNMHDCVNITYLTPQYDLTVTRQMPDRETAGNNITVNLVVDVNGSQFPNALGISENIPEGWTLVESDCSGIHISEENKIEFLLSSLALCGVEDQNITYTLQIPNTAVGNYTFSGLVDYGGFINPAILGDTTIMISLLTGDLNRDGKVELGEVVDMINLWVQGQATLSEAIDAITNWASQGD